jgi:spore maturation protein CgeB
MRIFYAAANSPNSRIRSNLWRSNLRGSLVQLEHELVDFDYDLQTTFQNLDPSNPTHADFIQQNRPRLSEALLSQIEKAHAQRPIDLLFTYFYNACVLPAVISQIRSLGIVTVNWFCNASFQFHLVSEIAPEYDYCLVPEKFRLEDYRRIKASPIYCQEAANPEIYHPYPAPERYDVAFIGQAYGERPGLIRSLLDHQVKVHVWGTGWEYYQKRRPSLNPLTWGRSNGAPKIPARLIGGVLSDEELVRTFSRTKINLGFAGCWTDDTVAERITQIRLRDFEIPMSGGFYLTEYQEEIEAFYDIDREIVCYRTKEELLDKIHFYLRHPAERAHIREAGRQRCLSEHTWAKRFEKAFGEIRVTNAE